MKALWPTASAQSPAKSHLPSWQVHLQRIPAPALRPQVAESRDKPALLYFDQLLTHRTHKLNYSWLMSLNFRVIHTPIVTRKSDSVLVSSANMPFQWRAKTLGWQEALRMWSHKTIMMFSKERTHPQVTGSYTLTTFSRERRTPIFPKRTWKGEH